MGSSSSTCITCLVTYEEWAVPPQLVAAVVLLLKSEEWAVPPLLVSPLVSLVAPVMLLLKSGQFLLH